MKHKFIFLYLFLIIFSSCTNKNIVTNSDLFLMNISNIQQTKEKENQNDKVIRFKRFSSSLSADLNEICKSEGINWYFEKDPAEIKPDRYIGSLMDCDWKKGIGSYSPHDMVLGGISKINDKEYVEFYCGEKNGFIFSFLIIITDSEINISRICRKGTLVGNIYRLDIEDLLNSNSE